MAVRNSLFGTSKQRDSHRDSIREIVNISKRQNWHSNVTSRSQLDAIKTDPSSNVPVFNPHNSQIHNNMMILQLQSDINSRVVNDNLVKLKNLRNKNKNLNTYVHKFKPKALRLHEKR